jgi:Cu/Ag efflux protein CusF
MKMRRALSVGFIAASPLWSSVALGQQPTPEACAAHEKAKANAPQKVEGRVMKVDAASGKITVQEADGKVHEFQASKATLQSMKAGDRIEATLRPSC